MPDTLLIERLAIHDLLCQFQGVFDLLDWQRMEGCLWEQLHVDYSSFRNEPPGIMMREDYIALRRAALSKLKMQHNFSNLLISVCGDDASAQCNYQILRFLAADCRSETDFFHSYGRYYLGLAQREGEWRICRIRQELIANHGTPGLHLAALAKQH
jgi:hypothetical protein